MTLKKQMVRRAGKRASIALLTLATGAGSAFAQGIPGGALLQVDNGTAANSAASSANVFETYAVTYTAGTTGNNFVLFAFRQDPDFWVFGNVSLTAAGSSTNLLTDPNFTHGGLINASAGGTGQIQAPAAWGIVWQNGVTPYAAGTWSAPGAPTTPPYFDTTGTPAVSAPGVNTGLDGSWFDGANGGFDGIYQGVSLTSGTSYTLSFTALTDEAATANGTVDGYEGAVIELGAYTGVCATLTGPASGCTVPTSSGFFDTFTPAQTANAGGGATTNIDTAQPSYLASNLDTAVNPVFQGGVLQTDQGGATYADTFTLDGSGTNTIDQMGNNSTFSGVFSDAVAGTPGSIIIANSATGGSVTFSGVNTYTGTTTVENGATLALSAGGSIATSAGVMDNGTFDISTTTGGAAIVTLSGSGAVVLGSRILALTDASDTFSGDISGAGGLAVVGGAETLTGVSGYSGGTLVNYASLAVNSDSALGAPTGPLTLANGRLTALASLSSARPVMLSGADTIDTGGHSVALSGVVSGAGGLIATGGGQLALTGTNSYAAGTAITGGTTLAVGADAALGAPSGPITFDNGTLLATNSFASARGIYVEDGGGIIDSNGYTVRLTGPIDLNGTLNSTGAGSVEFYNQAQVNGTLTIGGGLFSDNGEISAQGIMVTPDGILRGIGVVAAPTTVGGTLAPGNSPGTLTFTAPVVMLPGSTTAFDIDGTGTGTGAGNYSRIIVTGAGNSFIAAGTLMPRLRGITGSASNTYTPPIGQAFQVIAAAGGIPAYSGYAGLTQPVGLAPGTRFDALYAPTTLTLVITPAAYGNLRLAGIGETSGEQSVGSALDAVRPAAGLRMSANQQSLFYPLYGLTAPAITGALDQLSPVIYGDGLMAVRQGWYEGASSIDDQLADRRGGRPSVNAVAAPHGMTIWVNGVGQFADVSGTGGTGYHTDTGGAMAGVDKAFTPAILAGFAVGGSSAQTTAENGASVRGDLVQFSVYGMARHGLMFLDGQADYIHADQDVRRDLGFAGAMARNNVPAQGGGGQINGGLHFDIKQWQIEPTIGLSAMTLTSGSTTETSGGVFAEDIGRLSTTSVQSFAGVRVATAVNVRPNVPLRLRGLVGWSHELNDVTVGVPATLTSVGDSGAFSTSTAPVGRDALRLGAGFDVNVAANVSIYGSYSVALANDTTEQYLTGGVRIRW